MTNFPCMIRSDSSTGETRYSLDDPLVGCEARRVGLDYQVRLLLVDGPYRDERVNAELVIEAPFRYKAEDGRWHDIQPGDVTTLGPVVTMFGRTVQEATFDG